MYLWFEIAKLLSKITCYSFSKNLTVKYPFESYHGLILRILLIHVYLISVNVSIRFRNRFVGQIFVLLG